MHLRRQPSRGGQGRGVWLELGVHWQDNKATKLHYRHYAGQAEDRQTDRTDSSDKDVACVAHFEWNSKLLAY